MLERKTLFPFSQWYLCLGICVWVYTQEFVKELNESQILEPYLPLPSFIVYNDYFILEICVLTSLSISL